MEYNPLLTAGEIRELLLGFPDDSPIILKLHTPSQDFELRVRDMQQTHNSTSLTFELPREDS